LSHPAAPLQHVIPPSTATMTQPTTPPTGLTAAQQSAKGQLASDLNAVGLGSLADWAWNQYLTGSPETQIFLDMRNQQAYKDRFPGMAELQSQGQAISEAQYINYEQSAIGLMHSYGIDTATFGTRQQLGQYIGGQTSLAELGQRMQLASQAVTTTPQSTRDFLASQYGVSHGDLTGYFLDTKLSEPLLQQRFNAAQVGGAGMDTGVFGGNGINRTQAETLAQQGVTYSGALAGFGTLAHNALATQGNLAGLENQNTVGADTALAATFSHNGAAANALQNAEDAQRNQFGGGGVGVSNSGATGLGISTTN
jgi:hypothetical protein